MHPASDFIAAYLRNLPERSFARVVNGLRDAALGRHGALMWWMYDHYADVGVIDTIGFHLPQAAAPNDLLLFEGDEWECMRDIHGVIIWAVHRSSGVRVRFGKHGVGIQGEVARLCGFSTNEHVARVSIRQLHKAVARLLSYFPATTRAASLHGKRWRLTRMDLTRDFILNNPKLWFVTPSDALARRRMRDTPRTFLNKRRTARGISWGKRRRRTKLYCKTTKLLTDGCSVLPSAIYWRFEVCYQNVDDLRPLSNRMPFGRDVVVGIRNPVRFAFDYAQLHAELVIALLDFKAAPGADASVARRVHLEFIDRCYPGLLTWWIYESAGELAS